MPNIASVLKAEITRLARKEMRATTDTLRSAVTAYRSEIAALKRRTQALESELRRVRRSIKSAERQADEPQTTQSRFSASALASQRRRLGLSAHDMGLLLGTSGQSVYNWEAGKARPRAKYMSSIAALKTMGKKDAAVALESRRE
jgi:DNA-binding transcriptional regulator YiaG